MKKAVIRGRATTERLHHRLEELFARYFGHVLDEEQDATCRARFEPLEAFSFAPILKASAFS